MAEFVDDCMRCGAKAITFDVLGDHCIAINDYNKKVEALSCCRNCLKCSIAVFIPRDSSTAVQVRTGILTSFKAAVTKEFYLASFVTVAHHNAISAPEHLPEAVANCFNEGATTFSIGAYNAAAAMFRLALDIATKERLPVMPAEEGGPNSRQRKNLSDRLGYLFENSLLPNELRDLADCIREDGNDGAHDGTLTKADAEDLIDFTQALLERVYTEPARVELAKARRIERRSSGRPALTNNVTSGLENKA